MNKSSIPHKCPHTTQNHQLTNFACKLHHCGQIIFLCMQCDLCIKSETASWPVVIESMDITIKLYAYIRHLGCDTYVMTVLLIIRHLQDNEIDKSQTSYELWLDVAGASKSFFKEFIMASIDWAHAGFWGMESSRASDEQFGYLGQWIFKRQRILKWQWIFKWCWYNSTWSRGLLWRWAYRSWEDCLH